MKLVSRQKVKSRPEDRRWVHLSSGHQNCVESIGRERGVDAEKGELRRGLKTHTH